MLGVVSGKIIKPHKILIYVPPGVGKSTLSAHAPKPIFLGAEEGTNNLDVDRVAIPTMTDFYARLKEAREEKSRR